MNLFGCPEPAFCLIIHGIDIDSGFHQLTLFDPSSRRRIVVTMPNPDGLELPDYDPKLLLPLTKTMGVLGTHLKNLPPECVAIKVDADGNLLKVDKSPASNLAALDRRVYAS